MALSFPEHENNNKSTQDKDETLLYGDSNDEMPPEKLDDSGHSGVMIVPCYRSPDLPENIANDNDDSDHCGEMAVPHYMPPGLSIVEEEINNEVPVWSCGEEENENDSINQLDAAEVTIDESVLQVSYKPL